MAEGKTAPAVSLLRRRPKPKGAHPVGRFTDVQVRNLKQAGTYADGQGLYLRVAGTGGKCWFFRIWQGSAGSSKGKRHDLGLGGYPLISLSEARTKARELRKLAKSGGDFMAEHHKGRDVVTFEKMAREYHLKNAPQWKNAKATASWLSSMETHVFKAEPCFTTKPIDQLTQADCLRVLSPIQTTKKEAARKLALRMGLVFDWAKAHGHRSGESPMLVIRHGLSKVKASAKHHPALPFDQVSSFIVALRARSMAGVANRLAVEFLILTATRVGEARFAAWSEINFTTKTWTIPALRMKADKEHMIPLSGRCIQILEEAKAVADTTGLIFPGGRDKPLSENAFNNLAQSLGFRDEAGDNITAHGFRSTFRDWAGDKTVADRETIEHCLAHQLKNRVEAAYRRSTAVQKRATLMQAWANYATGEEAAGAM